jgi:hypothetical protein
VPCIDASNAGNSASFTGPQFRVAIYYGHDGESIPDPGIIVMGKVDAGVDALNVPGLVDVTFELIADNSR